MLLGLSNKEDAPQAQHMPAYNGATPVFMSNNIVNFVKTWAEIIKGA
jgi:hypothetical protein